MPQDVFIRQKQTVDFDDKVASISVAASAQLTPLAFIDTGLTYFRTRTGRRAFLAWIGNDVDAGGQAYITFHIYVNGNPIQKTPFNSFTQSIGETYNGHDQMAIKVPLPENALIEIRADNSDPVNAYGAYARLRVEYEDLN